LTIDVPVQPGQTSDMLDLGINDSAGTIRAALVGEIDRLAVT
jgi:hypothetical protein